MAFAEPDIPTHPPIGQIIIKNLIGGKVTIKTPTVEKTTMVKLQYPSDSTIISGE